MSVITIHAEDYLAAAIRDYAAKLGKSINVSVKELLSGALGLSKPVRRRHDLSKFAGILRKGESDEILANTKVFDAIDEEMWR